MYYVSYQEPIDSVAESGFWSKWIEKVLLQIVPLASPDFHEKYEEVSLWWLELNEDEEPQRELGFNARGEIIVAAPIGRNYGVWTDGGPRCVGFDAIEEKRFMEAWNNFENEFNNPSQT